MNLIINNIHQRFTKLYIVALGLVALLSLAGQVLVQVSLNAQSTDSRVINIAGRQRMLSQRICKNALLISHNISSSKHAQQLEELTTSLQTWEKVHLGLQAQIIEGIGQKRENSPTITALFDTINPHFRAIYTHAQKIVATSENSSSLKVPLDTILAHEGEFLKGMNKIVFQYDLESTDHLNTLKNIELVLLFFTLSTLLFEGFLIFRPAVNRLKVTMAKLIDSENNANTINEELSLVNANLRSTELELIKATNERHEEQMNQQKIRAASLLKGQESERKRIAREMHDGIGQMLTALKLNIESIATPNLDERNRLILEDVRQLVGKTIAETRNITFDLMPTVLNDFGITSALRQLAEQASKNSEVIIVFAEGNTFERLDKHIEISLYRIAQEAINNAVKYAQAKEITVSLSLKNNYLYLTIKDNGKGFDLKESYLDADQKKINRGIYNMQERTYLLNGEFIIKTAVGKGTKIQSKIPAKFQS